VNLNRFEALTEPHTRQNVQRSSYQNVRQTCFYKQHI